jgi:hypothetical protein
MILAGILGGILCHILGAILSDILDGMLGGILGVPRVVSLVVSWAAGCVVFWKVSWMDPRWPPACLNLMLGPWFISLLASWVVALMISRMDSKWILGEYCMDSKWILGRFPLEPGSRTAGRFRAGFCMGSKWLLDLKMLSGDVADSGWTLGKF